MYLEANDTQAHDLQMHLVTAGDEVIPIYAKQASKYSLWVRFLNSHNFKDGEEFAKLIIPVNGDSAKLGPCRLLSEPNIDGYAGRITFITDFFDLDSLLSNNKIVKLQSEFLNLPLVLAHKENIFREFKDYTSNLNYDLNVYKNLFDKLDSEYQGEPEDVKSLVQRAIIDTEGRKFRSYFDESLEKLESIVKGFSKEEHERHGFYLRKQLWNIIMCAPFMARTNLKPRGYSGDSEMMRMIYANEYAGDSTFAKILNKHPLDHPGSQAVRNRRTLISKKLTEIKNRCRNHADGRCRVLSVACGPAFELKDLLSSAEDFDTFHFTLLDQDKYALFEAAVLVDQIEKSLDRKIGVNYLNESVRTMLATRNLEGQWGRFDFIYSMGLFDYLTPPVAAAVLKKLYELLSPGGEMVIGNFHVSNPSRYYMEYWLDWVLYYRSESDFKELLGDAPSAVMNVSFEDTRVQMFLHVTKNA
jgi:extracellular factor (EF) 3-hydroxypalmitic acid methyl ester biosynthesis protein